MRLSDFDFDLPQELIAQIPAEKREGSRMMVLDRKTGKITHSLFKDFPAYLTRGDTLVLNNTKVIPARVWGTKKETSLEFLFLRKIQRSIWEVLCRPAKKARTGDRISFFTRLEAEIIEEGPEGRRILRFNTPDVLKALQSIGYAPLPPYIKRSRNDLGKKDLDLQRYQTVFAKKAGSIAAPTAGLHFTGPLLQRLRSSGVDITEITLDVGLATFQPVRTEVIEKHRMLTETYTITSRTAQILNQAKSRSCPIVAVGTTSVRTLESAGITGRIKPGRHETDLFIYPGYSFQIVDRLMTNFHLPKSTLLMMVAAFAGLNFVKDAYVEAVRKKYRFFSYGDCMLIL